MQIMSNYTLKIKLILLILISTLSYQIYGQSYIVDKVIAKVGSENILLSDLEGASSSIPSRPFGYDQV